MTHCPQSTHTSLLKLSPQLDQVVLSRCLLAQRDKVLLSRLQPVEVRRDTLRVARELLNRRGQKTLRLLRVLLQVVDAQAGCGGEAEELEVSLVLYVLRGWVAEWVLGVGCEERVGWE